MTNDLSINSIKFENDVSQWMELKNMFFSVHEDELFDARFKTGHPTGCPVLECMTYSLQVVVSEGKKETIFDRQRYLTFCAVCVSANIDSNKTHRILWYFLSVLDPDLGEIFFDKLVELCQLATNKKDIELIQRYFVEMHQHLETCVNQQDNTFATQLSVFRRLLSSQCTSVGQVDTLLDNINLLMQDNLPIKPSDLINMLLDFVKTVGEVCLTKKVNISDGFSELMKLAHAY